MEKYTLLVNTNSYAGNFERELTAYCTGVIGECEVGEELVDNFNDEIAFHFNIPCDYFSDSLEQRADDYDCYRPCQIERNKDGIYNTVGINFYNKPTEKEVNIIKYAANKFGEQNNIDIISFSLKVETTTIEETIVDSII